MTFAESVIAFNEQLKYTGKLPDGIRVMNPFKENKEALRVSSEFYRKFFSDNRSRKIILGINPGRFGAGVTGIPFTDTKRLESACGIEINDITTHEPSSVFIYEMIDAYGGVKQFYSDIFIHAVCPLGFVKLNPGGKEINYNYYDSKELAEMATPFIVESVNKMMSFGIDRKTCFCLGNNQNYKFLTTLNRQCKWFGTIEPLEHPRFIMQYRAKRKDEYVDKYVKTLRMAHG